MMYYSNVTILEYRSAFAFSCSFTPCLASLSSLCTALSVRWDCARPRPALNSSLLLAILPVTAVIARASVVTYINYPCHIISVWSTVVRVQTMTEHDAIILIQYII